ncbi:MAG: glycogen/starch/alpha-glucan phosphorylase [Phycisphaerae bacterium]|nr:glycogen/starch/alpha-glucan phosphorylase [Phycisphaerae bacterium]
MNTQQITKSALLDRDERLGLDVESLRGSILSHLRFTQAKVPGHATERDVFVAVAMAVRDRLIDRWIATRRAYYERADTKRVYYLSLEFLIGRTLGNSLVNLQLYDELYQALFELGYDLEQIRELEEEAGLGNGGLGRLAACFLDSMATLELPAYGYGLRYEQGMFTQRIRDGRQVEEPDDWLRSGSPWEIARPEDVIRIQYYGRSESYRDLEGQLRFRWVDTADVLALPYDVPVPGYRNNTVNTLRLFAARATNEFDLNYFNHGDYLRACQDKSQAENITKVLYPKDDFAQGQELRLKQEYLLVSASLQEILQRFRSQHEEWAELPERAAIQLNDTHPALAIPEAMRLLMDFHGLGWEQAWDITTRVFAYTNHTVLPEALETWPVALMERLLPRHMQVIYEINRRFLDDVRCAFPHDPAAVERMSLIQEEPQRRVRMANLAIVGSHSVNGVSALHSRILVERLFRDFDALYPAKFNNKTNGITPRRWLKKANAPLAYLISEAIGDAWLKDLDELHRLIPFAGDASFCAQWREIKRLNKERLGEYLKKTQGLRIKPDWLLDCQVKRIHEYKRQLLNILHVITLFQRIRRNPGGDFLPRTVLIAGKAAPGYHRAKLIIHLANAVGRTIENDPFVRNKLRVVFPENYGVSLAEAIIPAAELSEQISTAGMEASGTGNMKFALNGAVTIGTLDGANVEIREAVGDNNIFTFGLTAEEVEAARASGYNPWRYYQSNEELRQALLTLCDDTFCPEAPGTFQPIYDALLHHGDYFLVLADYEAYIRCQNEVEEAYRDVDRWTRLSILNTANMGRFSSDRTIQEYARDIWRAKPVKVRLASGK